MAKQGLLRGPTFNMRHTTIIEAALPFVQLLKGISRREEDFTRRDQAGE